MDRKTKNNVLVGLVVSAGFLAFLFVLFNIEGGTGILTSQYTLKARFADVKGLHTGSEVSLSGLRVGVVQNILVSNDERKELIISMSISNDIREQLRADSMATIQTQGVLGDKYIELSIGSQDQPVLEPGDFIQSRVLEDIFKKSGALVEGIQKKFEETGDVSVLLKDLDHLVKNLNIIVKDVKEQKGMLNTLIYDQNGKKLSQSIAHLEAILRKIDQGKGSVGALINDPTVYEDVKALLGGAKRSNVLRYFLQSFISEGDEANKAKN